MSAVAVTAVSFTDVAVTVTEVMAAEGAEYTPVLGSMVPAPVRVLGSDQVTTRH